MKNSILPILLLTGNFLFAQNQAPVLTNVQVELGANNTFLINFDLTDAESDPVTVSLRAGTNGSSKLDYVTDNATGDIGANITPGIGKQITWDFSDYLGVAMNDFRLMLVADDEQTIDIQSLVDMVDSTRLNGDLTFLEGVRHRSTGAAHLEETKEFIRSQFFDHGLETYNQTFAFGNYEADNIIGKSPGTGTNGETYILGGHFDTRSNSPGADDNGSAVAGMMEAMRILSKYPAKKTIKFIGFDLEEDGLLGSARYVSTGILNGEEVAGMIDFEMIGYYTEAPNTQTLPQGFNLLFADAYNEVAAQDFKGNFITNVSKSGESADLMNSFRANSQTFVPDLRVINVQTVANWQTLTPDLGRSDHAPFWVANLPAIMLTDGADFRNPNYHTAGDTVGTINFTFMSNVVKGTVATLAQLAEVQHADSWWVDTDFFTDSHEAFDCVVKISPNPAHDLLMLDWSGCHVAVQQVTLLDATGRTVSTTKTSGLKDELRLEGLSSGIYFLKIESAKGRLLEKIVVE